MGIHNYIEKELLHKNIGTYFRRGKWIFHALFLLAFFTYYIMNYGGPGIKNLSLLKVNAALALTLPFISFFYIYCLYLIPYCFKRNRYRQFWLLLIGLLAVFPFADYLLQCSLLPVLPKLAERLEGYTPWFVVARNYFDFITSFVGFTAMLYLMELLESVNLNKETIVYRKELMSTRLHRIKTQMNPEFMVRSLDGIIRLAEQADAKAPDAVVDFSDVLRYRLYRSKERLVSLQEELAQLNNLLTFHNTIPGQAHTCTLETEGLTEGALVVPLSLINIAEPLLTTYIPDSDWSVLIYLLVEEKEIQVAVEITAPEHSGIEQEAERIRHDLEQLLYSGLIFTIEKEQNNYSLRTCIPIIRNSTAS